MKRFGIVIGAAAVLAWTQGAPALLSQQRQAFQSRSDIVEVFATATGRNGAGVHDLRGDEFELLVDGKPREIAVFSALVQPLSVAIVLDHSGSTQREFPRILQAAGAFVGRLFKEDRARVGTLAWDCLPFTSDRTTIVDGLQTLMPKDPGSPVWSAANRAMSALAAEPGRRVILLLSDGVDNQSEMLNLRAQAARPPNSDTHGCVRADTTKLVELPEVIDRTERDSVMVYAVVVPDVDLGTQPPIIQRKGPASLAKLTKRSGGSVHQLTDYSQLEAAFKVIADELHLQYLLGFEPGTFDGKSHDITVRVKRPGVSIRARQSYIAPVIK